MTTTQPKAGRCLKVFRKSYGEYLTFLGVVIADNGEYDGYCVAKPAGVESVTWEHEHDATRRYTVKCEGGTPTECNCPAQKRPTVVCKHRKATAALTASGYFKS